MTILARLTVKALPARVESQGRESQMIITTTLISCPQKKTTKVSPQRTDCPISRNVFSLTSIQLDNMLRLKACHLRDVICI